MSAVGKGIRWVLVPVSAVAVVVSCIAAARAVVVLADQACATGSLIGGACVEPWHTTVVEAAIYTSIVLAVAGLVVVPAIIAPHLKRTVAVVLFISAAGVAVAAYLQTSWADLLTPLLVLVLSGVLALWWVWSRRRTDDAS